MKKDYDALFKQYKELEDELSETKDYLNQVFQLVKIFLPMCPATTKKLLAKTMKDGKKLRSEGTHKIDALTVENALLTKQVSDLEDTVNTLRRKVRESKPLLRIR